MTTMPVSPYGSSKSLILLSHLLLAPGQGAAPTLPTVADPDLRIRDISREEFDDMLALASSHHVVARGLELFLQIAQQAGDKNRAEWATTAIAAERARIENAMSFLQRICAAFQAEGYDITVIKSLDHWPDLGSDLDLYTNAGSADVLELMTRNFEAQLAPRSWGDRLARKWNFVIPGLPEAVEIHMGRLGQTGEQVAIASSLARRSRLAPFGTHTFRVPVAADRLMISVLQRMYRHFYFRLCDIVDTAALSETASIDYEDLRLASKVAGIWKGVASYLAIVSDYLKCYRSEGLDLPAFVTAAARFGGDEIHFNRGFLRIPIMPQSAKLYGSQLTTLLLHRELKNSVRLSLLPCLATAAAVGHKITGSDKGIW
ncbi:MAG TPA: hypothetical protein VKR57_13180 [Terriglobales bacterium]|nr:hypothetical protein [Terriglobales bacterium]